MRFTDLFIQRPVLAVVINLLILLAGGRALLGLSVAQFPEVSNALVTVTTVYPGADADLVKGFVTTPLQQAIAEAEGIDYLASSSVRGLSVIEAFLRTNYDANDALTQITTKLNQVRNELPAASELPTVDVQVGAAAAVFYVSFASDLLTGSQITDWILRVAQPRFATVPGVQTADTIGARVFAMRIWLDPARMAALRVTASDVREALERNNYLSGAGTVKGRSESFSVTTNTNLISAEEFRELVIRERGNTQIRLGDVAKIELGAESYEQDVRINGERAVFIAIETAPGANLLETLAGVRAALEELKEVMPASMRARVNRDASDYVREAIRQVLTTLIEALLIVVAVIFLFLGSLRSTVIPAVAVPLSLIGVGSVMLALGFTVNLLTLLAMVLAIGLVVDDAIIVVENIHRHIEHGMAPRDAAVKGARELSGAVIAMTITLLAVYAPIGLVGGVTGTLFAEFAFTLAGSVLISGLVALTLSPVMCAKLFRPSREEGRFSRWLDRLFAGVRSGYLRVLHATLNARALVVLVGAGMLVSCYFLYRLVPSELAPLEDDGVLLYQAEAPPNTSLDQLSLYSERLIDIATGRPEVEDNFHFNGGRVGRSSTAFGGLGFTPSAQRELTVAQLLPILQQAFNEVTGLQIAVFPLPSLPSAGRGFPVQYVITTTDDPEQLFSAAEALLAEANGSGLFAFANSNMKFDNARVNLKIDRAKAIDLGLDMQELGRDLAVYLGDGYVNRFNLSGRAYKVIPQVQRAARINPEQILSYPIRTDSGEMLPLSAVASISRNVEPRELLTFQQLNAATISAVPAPGVTLGEALAFLEEKAAELLPRSYGRDYAGQSRLFKAEQGSLVWTFFFAVVIIYLVLAAQFESFRDPFIMLVTVPLSVSGALLFLALGYATMNIYTQVGLVTLIGLISKHGILIVQFANQLRAEQGLKRREAVEQACAIRLRPILMTTAAIVLAVMPLVLADGAGAASRSAIGIVIASGMSIGTLFTLFVVPAVYTFVARGDQPVIGLAEQPRPATAPASTQAGNLRPQT
jgi:multidrug efflux pump